MAESLNLYQKMLKVSEAVMSVEKNMTVGAGSSSSYKAVADYDVVVAVKKAEVKFGVISIPVSQRIVESKVLTTTTTYNGKTTQKNTFVDDVEMTVRFINVDDPSQTLDVVAYGRGIDAADKGFGKASTYARKYCLLNAYKIATGEDPDKDMSQDIQSISEPRKAQGKGPKVYTMAGFHAGEYADVIGYLSKHIDPATQDLDTEAVKVVNKPCYQWEEGVLDEIVKAAKKKAFVDDLNGH